MITPLLAGCDGMATDHAIVAREIIAIVVMSHTHCQGRWPTEREVMGLGAARARYLSLFNGRPDEVYQDLVVVFEWAERQLVGDDRLWPALSVATSAPVVMGTR